MNLLNLYLNNNEYTYTPLREICKLWHDSESLAGRAIKDLYDNDIQKFAEGAATGMQHRIVEKLGHIEVDHETGATIMALAREIRYEIENYEE
jgi:hypothetical protein